MRRVICAIFMCFVSSAYAATDLNVALESVRLSCVGLSQELEHMKTMADVGTAVTAVGSVAGGVALGAGIAKAQVDKKVEELETQIIEAEGLRLKKVSVYEFYLQLGDMLKHVDGAADAANAIDMRRAELERLVEQSKNLGNWRTGTVAAAMATNVAGAVISGTNRTDDDFKGKINACISSVQQLSNARMQARLDGTADDATLVRVEKIVNACGAWDTVDVNSINNRSTGATVSSGIGAGLGLAGTITSGVANSEQVRSATGVDAQKKEKNLNTAANVLAGGTTVAGVSATIFNATQIVAIKRAVEVAEECEELLK